MFIYYYLAPLLWFIYYTAFEIKVVTTDKALKKEGKLVNPDFKTISHLRYIASVITLVVSLVAVTLLAVLFPNSKVGIYVSAVVLTAGTPFLNWLWFYMISQHLITKAKMERLKETLANKD